MTIHTTYIKEHKDRFLSELFELLRIPSISQLAAHKGDVARAAEWVSGALTTAGADNVRVIPTAGHPVVYGEKLIDTKLPTILVYGHYDVQPVEPLAEWKTDPFEPVIKGGNIYGRGATDDKGQMYMHIKALEMMLATDTLPCNLKFVIEGEEEIGSKHFADFCKAHKKLLKSDASIVSDSYMPSLDVPVVELGARGICYFEMTLKALDTEVHSGIYGGAVPNVLQIVSDMLASLHDSRGRVNVPHFYDDAAPLSKKERALIAQLPFDEKAYRKAAGNVKALCPEDGYSALESTMVRPTLEIHGIQGGYNGEGAKTAIPTSVRVKFSTRLVAGQDPRRIEKLVIAHLKHITPKSVQITIDPQDHYIRPYALPIDSITYKAAELAMVDAFGKMPLARRCGGSIGALPIFEDIVGVQPVVLGFGLDDDRAHGPNEKFGVKNFLKGIETIPRFYYHYVQLAQKAKNTAKKAGKK